jgi:hypothetical protein
LRLCASIALWCCLLCSPLSTGVAYASVPSCPAPFASLLDGRVFHNYAVHVAPNTPRPVQPNVSSGRARLYRTRIREGAEQGPNFADRYTIIRIGCGAATLCVAIEDATTGQVYFPPELRSVEALIVDTGRVAVDTLNFRRDSRLLIVVGSPNEQRRRAGISYYTWRSGRLSLIRFTPAAELCGLPASTQF